MRGWKAGVCQLHDDQEVQGWAIDSPKRPWLSKMGRAKSVVTLTNHERRTRRAAASTTLQETATEHPEVKDVYIIISGCPDTMCSLSPPESPNNCESKANVAPPSASTSIDSLQHQNQNHYLMRPEKRRTLRRNRPRSSTRLFFIILNLVGVSRNVVPRGARSNIESITSNWASWSAGPVGVQPSAILLERLNIESSRRGLKGIVERTERVKEMGESQVIDDPLDEPYWFQDNEDGRCLGPSGEFGECGDATLWRVKRRPLSKRETREKRYRDLFRKERLERASRNQRPLQDSSSVCVWPFFRGQDCRIHQATQFEYDEIYGFEYSNEESEDAGFALQLMNVDAVTANASLSFGQRGDAKAGSSIRMRGFFEKRPDRADIDGNDDECLVPTSSSDGSPAKIEVGPCKSPNAYTWHINRDGILVRGSTKAERRKRRIRDTLNPIRRATVASSGADSIHSSDEFKCVFRSKTTSANLLSCNEGKINKVETSSMVQFSLVRYPTISTRTPRPTQHTDTQVPSWEPWINMETSSSIGRHDDQTDDKFPSAAEKVEQHLPSSKTNSQRHAAGGQKMVDLKPTSSMLRTSLDASQGRPRKNFEHTSASHIRDSPATMNGVAFHDQRLEENKGLPPPSAVPPAGKRIRLDRKERKKGNFVSHDEPFDRRTLESDSSPHRPRKIPVHSYIQSAKDFIWIDPLTSLAYPTDLCEYLGHKKVESGRHTLTGVGQYYRTAFNIKGRILSCFLVCSLMSSLCRSHLTLGNQVYGVALYVSKRDVLADSKFGEFAALSADELRERDDFYTHLMNMPDPGEDPASTLGGHFDRTLFIKMNMQLSTDAMRKSLEADWSLLTDEMKYTVIESSLKERQADERMQAKIQSKENPSNCSCGQLAPDELKADPSCCARGTELVFTWRKNGDFEIRIDGRVMDVFKRPDIAKGIFSEYLVRPQVCLAALYRSVFGLTFSYAPSPKEQRPDKSRC